MASDNEGSGPGHGVPHRARLDGRGPGPARTPSGGRRPSGRSRTSRSPARRSSARRSRALAPIKGGGRRGQRRARRARRGHRRRRSPTAADEVAARRAATTQFPIDVFQTGSGTSSQHEHQRGASPRWPPSALGRDGAPQRPRQRLAVVQRRLPDRDPRRRHRARRPRPDPGARAPARRRSSARPTSSPTSSSRGRTHLMDATPVTLGQEFGGYAAQVALRHRAAAGRRCPGSPSCRSAAPPSAPASTPRPASPPRVIAMLADATGLPLTEARDHFEAQGARDGLVEASGQLRTIAVGLDQDRQRPALDGLRARAPASARSTCPTCSRARRSCRARSTRCIPEAVHAWSARR